MVLREEVYRSMGPGTVRIANHYVIEVNIRHVVSTAPGTGNTGDKGDRVVDDVTRIVTKAHTLGEALRKAERLLGVEGEDFGDSLLGDEEKI